MLWLAPDPDASFRALTAAVWHAFPDHPPYGGAFQDVVPHLTIGMRAEARVEQLVSVETEVQRHLPVCAAIDRVQLIAGTSLPGSWHTLHELPLGPRVTA